MPSFSSLLKISRRNSQQIYQNDNGTNQDNDATEKMERMQPKRNFFRGLLKRSGASPEFRDNKRRSGESMVSLRRMNFQKWPSLLFVLVLRQRPRATANQLSRCLTVYQYRLRNPVNSPQLLCPTQINHSHHLLHLALRSLKLSRDPPRYSNESYLHLPPRICTNYSPELLSFSHVRKVITQVLRTPWSPSPGM